MRSSSSIYQQIHIPTNTPGVPISHWFDALVGIGGQAQRRLLKGSGCTAMSLRGETPDTDLRVADMLYVEVKAPTKEALAEGTQRVRRAIAEVLECHGVAAATQPQLPSPATPPQQPPPAEEQVIVVPTAPTAPPPAWGAAPPPAPAAPALADEACAEQSCGVCLADVIANVRMEPCGHYACVTCVAGLRRRALFVSVAGVPCPFCRTIVVRYDAPPGVDVGLQPAAAPETSLALRATLPPLEIRRPPPAVVTKASRDVQAPPHPLYKTAMCKRWSESGTCDFGPRCHFAHGEAELRPREPRTESRDFFPASSHGDSSAPSWRSAPTAGGTSNDSSPQRVERAQPSAVPPDAAPTAPAPVEDSSPSAAPDELPPAQAAAAPGMPPWLMLALGAQQPSPPVADTAAPATAPEAASTAPETSLAGTPWELILRLDDNSF